MRKLYLILLVSTLVSSAYALTDTTVVTKPKADFSGFFRFEYWYDTRQNVEAIDGLFLLYPKAPSLDANGEDILAAWVKLFGYGNTLENEYYHARYFWGKIHYPC